MSSRIFIKYLPPTLTEDDFKKHFSTQSPVTDSRLFPGRRIGYIGYKTTKEAQDAVKFFNKSYIRMSRIGVELARSTRDEDPRQAKLVKDVWPRRDERSAPSDQLFEPEDDEGPRKRRKVAETLDLATLENDPDYRDFMESKLRRATTTPWLTAAQKTTAPAEQHGGLPQPAGLQKQSTLDEKSGLRHASDQKAALSIKPTETKTQDPRAMHHIKSQNTPHINDVSQEDEKEGLSMDLDDSEWLRSRTSRTLDLVNNSPTRSLSGDDDTQGEGRAAVEEHIEEQVEETANIDLNEQKILDTGRLFVRNLSYDAKEDDLRDHFGSHGSLTEVHVSVDAKSHSSKGFAYILYEKHEDALEAYRTLDKTVFMGRLLHILPGEAKRGQRLDEFQISQLPLKKQKEIKRKQAAASSQFNWNSLYMSTDAVISSMAQRLGVSKSAIVDPTSSDAAVKQAHAETAVIQETKNYFKKQGVDLASFERKERGDEALLIKNFPFGTTAEDLSTLLTPHGAVGRILLPPTGTIAVVEFFNAPDARKAFAALAYKKYDGSILFLEKAPKNVFSGQAEANSEVDGGKEVKGSGGDHLNETDAQADTDMITTSIYIKNLNFKTTSKTLITLFKPLDGFVSARVQMKPDPSTPGNSLSMGYGFVEFRSKEQAQTAQQVLDGHSLDGYKLSLRLSHKGLDAAAERAADDREKRRAGAKTKIIIKNLPFEATAKDVRALFAVYGTLRSVRVPRKFNSASKGFAFADFLTKRDAQRAMDALRDTHLLGRRLVLEFAQDELEDPEEVIAQMERKVKRQSGVMANFQKSVRLSKNQMAQDAGDDR